MTVKGETQSGETKAELVVQSGTIQGYYYGISGNGTRHGTSVTINGGHIIGYLAGDSTGIYQPQEGTLIITGGIIEGATGVEVRSGTLIVTSGTITGTASSYSCTAQQNGPTTIGAGIAIAQHTTKKAITASVTGGNITGVEPISVKDPQGNGTLGGSSADKVDVSLSEAYVKSLGAEVPEGYGWAKEGATYKLHQHIYNSEAPKWRWQRIDGGEMKADSVHTCTVSGCGYKKFVSATVASSGSEGNTTYTATESGAGGQTGTFITTDSFSVTLSTGEGSVSGGTEGSGSAAGGSAATFKWGDIATCLCDNPSLWKINDRKVADGTKKYVFAVTGNTTLSVENPSSADMQAVASTTITGETGGKAVINARWSLPDEARVTSAIIYRGYTQSVSSVTVTKETLVSQGTQYDTGLKVRNGDFTLQLENLTAGNTQYALVRVEYTVNGVPQTLTSNVASSRVD